MQRLYELDEKTARSIAEPAAACAVRWLPDWVLNSACETSDIGRLLAATTLLIRQLKRGEEELVASYNRAVEAAATSRVEASASAGYASPEHVVTRGLGLETVEPEEIAA